MITLGSCISPQAGTPLTNEDVPRNTQTSRVVTISLSPAPVLGIVVDIDLAVIEVEPRSAAELAAIQKGDVLESIEHMPFVEGRDAIKELIAAYQQEDKPLQLKLHRNGEAVVVEVRPLPFQIQGDESKPQPTVTPVFLPNFYY